VVVGVEALGEDGDASVVVGVEALGEDGDASVVVGVEALGEDGDASVVVGVEALGEDGYASEAAGDAAADDVPSALPAIEAGVAAGSVDTAGAAGIMGVADTAVGAAVDSATRAEVLGSLPEERVASAISGIAAAGEAEDGFGEDTPDWLGMLLVIAKVAPAALALPAFPRTTSAGPSFTRAFSSFFFPLVI